MKPLAFTIVFAVFLSGSSRAQDVPIEGEVVHPNLRITVPNLPALTAVDQSGTAVAKAGLDIIFSAAKLKCEGSFHLESVMDGYAGPRLRTLTRQIASAPCTVDGRAARVTAWFVPNGEIQADSLIVPLAEGYPLLLRWKDVLYVLYGVVYDEHLRYNGSRDNVIRELLLIDPRYSDERRLVVFRRDKDDFTQVEGIAGISARH